MSKRIAIVDVPKSGGNPLLNLPAEAVVKRNGKLWRITYREHTLFAQVLLSNANRWIAFVAAPARAFLWLEERVGADVYELTWQRWQNNKAALANLGLVGEVIDGEEVLRLPHVIAGQSPFLRNPNNVG
jgi:hypothetical protein